MKVYNHQDSRSLPSELEQTLREIRRRRAFQAAEYIQEKSKILNTYLRRFSLQTCVVGVSGGLDSAVTLALVCQAAKEVDSPIRHIKALLLPIFSEQGTSNQRESVVKSEELCRALGVEAIKIDLTAAQALLSKQVSQALGISPDPWAEGQLISYLRTPALYFVTSLMTTVDAPGVVVGTTNKDEGSYLGFFGKASDAMVDLQLISDIHKSEVFQLGLHLNIPQSILETPPNGDMFDNRTDEEVFGTSYDFVELYLHFLNLTETEQNELIQSWLPQTKTRFQELAARLEKLHSYNQHKYLAGSPAVHLDIFPSSVPNGWQNKNPLIQH